LYFNTFKIFVLQDNKNVNKKGMKIMKVSQKSNINHGQSSINALFKNLGKETKFPNTSPTGFIQIEKINNNDVKFPNTSPIDFSFIEKKQTPKNVEKPLFDYYF